MIRVEHLVRPLINTIFCVRKSRNLVLKCECRFRRVSGINYFSRSMTVIIPGASRFVLDGRSESVARTEVPSKIASWSFSS